MTRRDDEPSHYPSRDEIEHYVRKAHRLRAHAFRDFFRAAFIRLSHPSPPNPMPAPPAPGRSAASYGGIRNSGSRFSVPSRSNFKNRPRFVASGDSA